MLYRLCSTSASYRYTATYVTALDHRVLADRNWELTGGEVPVVGVRETKLVVQAPTCCAIPQAACIARGNTVPKRPSRKRRSDETSARVKVDVCIQRSNSPSQRSSLLRTPDSYVIGIVCKWARDTYDDSVRTIYVVDCEAGAVVYVRAVRNCSRA